MGLPGDLDYLKDINIDVVLGTSLTITVQDFSPVDYQFYPFWIGQFLPPIVGTEQVFMKTLTGTVTYPWIDRAGNIVLAGRLRGGKPCPGGIRAHKYCLRFGANGLPAATPHFVVYDGLCPLIYNGTAGSLPPVV